MRRFSPILPALLGLLAALSCERTDNPGDGPSGGSSSAEAPGNAPDGGQPANLETITTKDGIEMVRIPAGEFAMGDDRGEPEERPAHTVRLSAFYIDKHEVTQEHYRALMGTARPKFKGPGRPIDSVSWVDAARYCNARSRREGLTPCYDASFRCNFEADGYRLPTEAEWEYACRARTKARYSFGDAPARLAEHAWFKGNAAKTTHPVGRKRPNPWGLHDMHGNVAEWCHDRYSETYYADSPPADPRGPAQGAECVLRGGSWRSRAEACRCAARDSERRAFTDACFGIEAYGFRCVRRAGR